MKSQKQSNKGGKTSTATYGTTTMRYKMHTPLFILHCLAFLLTFVAGVFLLIYSNFLTSSLLVMHEVRVDPAFRPLSEEVGNPESQSQRAVRDLRNCMLVVGGVSLGTSVVVLANLYCFLSLMFSPRSALVKAAPCMEVIRDQLEVEVASMDIQRDV